MARKKFEVGDEAAAFLARDSELEVLVKVVGDVESGRYIVELATGQRMQRWQGQLRLIRRRNHQ